MGTKYIFVTGGVVSGLGKGCVSAALGVLINQGQKIVPIKCDGYLNVDPGTINPYEHGEVYVLNDGGEVDMDFGHYERFLNIDCNSSWSITSGKIFHSLINKERRGEFLGKTIQIFPHVIDEIKQAWKDIAKSEHADVCIIEIGGTVGDWESQWFVEAARQIKRELGANNVLYTHLTYVPFLSNVNEFKTKPAQRDTALLREKGIVPDVLMCRSEGVLDEKMKAKLALFCDVDTVVGVPDVPTIYDIPLIFRDEKVTELIKEKMLLNVRDLSSWEILVNRLKKPTNEVTIAICGKYTDMNDSYASVREALRHAGAHLDCGVNIRLVETTELKDVSLQDIEGILVPGGFGSRGTDGKIKMIQHAREEKIPYLGICFGLQLAVVEYARNVCGILDANSTELDPVAPHPVIMYIPGQSDSLAKGATMRLGKYAAHLLPGSLVAHLYGCEIAIERHRHRYEVNPEYHALLEENGLVLSGKSPDGKLVEFIELQNHPYFVATQAHNEFTSRLEKPNPLFYGFVKAAMENKSR